MLRAVALASLGQVRASHVIRRDLPDSVNRHTRFVAFTARSTDDPQHRFGRNWENDR